MIVLLALMMIAFLTLRQKERLQNAGIFHRMRRRSAKPRPTKNITTRTEQGSLSCTGIITGGGRKREHEKDYSDA
jgi:hypothetical protein